MVGREGCMCMFGGKFRRKEDEHRHGKMTVDSMCACVSVLFIGA